MPSQQKPIESKKRKKEEVASTTTQPDAAPTKLNGQEKSVKRQKTEDTSALLSVAEFQKQISDLLFKYSEVDPTSIEQLFSMAQKIQTRVKEQYHHEHRSKAEQQKLLSNLLELIGKGMQSTTKPTFTTLLLFLVGKDQVIRVDEVKAQLDTLQHVADQQQLQLLLILLACKHQTEWSEDWKKELVAVLSKLKKDENLFFLALEMVLEHLSSVEMQKEIIKTVLPEESITLKQNASLPMIVLSFQLSKLFKKKEKRSDTLLQHIMEELFAYEERLGYIYKHPLWTDVLNSLESKEQKKSLVQFLKGNYLQFSSQKVSAHLEVNAIGLLIVRDFLKKASKEDLESIMSIQKLSQIIHCFDTIGRRLKKQNDKFRPTKYDQQPHLAVLYKKQPSLMKAYQCLLELNEGLIEYTLKDSSVLPLLEKKLPASNFIAVLDAAVRENADSINLTEFVQGKSFKALLHLLHKQQNTTQVITLLKTAYSHLMKSVESGKEASGKLTKIVFKFLDDNRAVAKKKQSAKQEAESINFTLELFAFYKENRSKDPSSLITSIEKTIQIVQKASKGSNSSIATILEEFLARIALYGYVEPQLVSEDDVNDLSTVAKILLKVSKPSKEEQIDHFEVLVDIMISLLSKTDYLSQIMITVLKALLDQLSIGSIETLCRTVHEILLEQVDENLDVSDEEDEEMTIATQQTNGEDEEMEDTNGEDENGEDEEEEEGNGKDDEEEENGEDEEFTIAPDVLQTDGDLSDEQMFKLDKILAQQLRSKISRGSDNDSKQKFAEGILDVLRNLLSANTFSSNAFKQIHIIIYSQLLNLLLQLKEQPLHTITFPEMVAKIAECVQSCHSSSTYTKLMHSQVSRPLYVKVGSEGKFLDSSTLDSVVEVFKQLIETILTSSKNDLLVLVESLYFLTHVIFYQNEPASRKQLNDCLVNYLKAESCTRLDAIPHFISRISFVAVDLFPQFVSMAEEQLPILQKEAAPADDEHLWKDQEKLKSKIKVGSGKDRALWITKSLILPSLKGEKGSGNNPKNFSFFINEEVVSSLSKFLLTAIPYYSTYVSSFIKYSIAEKKVIGNYYILSALSVFCETANMLSKRISKYTTNDTVTVSEDLYIHLYSNFKQMNKSILKLLSPVAKMVNTVKESRDHSFGSYKSLYTFFEKEHPDWLEKHNIKIEKQQETRESNMLTEKTQHNMKK